MGALIGLAFGVGVLLLWASRSESVPRSSGTSRSQRMTELLAQAGLSGVRPGQFIAVSVAAGLVVAVLTAAATRSATIAVAFGLFGSYAPLALVKGRRRRRGVELRELWPEVVDNLASAVRAGLSLPEAVAQLAVRGPDPLRPAFHDFAVDYRTTGRFSDSLDRLKASLADPVADRIIESLRVTREVGGGDLGRLLRTLSQFLREDARTRAELETRQGWTVNGAKLALAAPWVVLALLAIRPETVAAYDSATGALVLAVGGGVSVGAYRLMLRIARLPEDERVLR
jgi:tight adherence protein B